MPATPPLAPPIAPRKPHTFSTHNIAVEDPYAWLRDPNYPDVNDPEILAYLEAENAYFDAHMAPLKPLVESLFAELKARRPEADASVPYQHHGFWYQWRFAKDAQYRTWYRAVVEDQWQVLLDENSLAAGHEYFSLGALTVSPDGLKLAYSVDTDGSERYTLHVVDIATGDACCEPIANTLGEPVWNDLSDAFLYVVVNEQWQPLEVYRHSLAELGTRDPCIFAEQDTSCRVDIGLSQSEAFVFISTGGHTNNEVYVLPRSNLGHDPQLMQAKRDDVEYYPDHGNGQFVIRSNQDLPNFAIYTCGEASMDSSHWQLQVASDNHRYITGHMVLADYLIVTERVDGLDQIHVFDNHGTEHYIAFPEAAYAVGLGTNPEFHSNTLRLGYNSMVTPITVYDYNLSSHELITRKVQQIPSGYEASQFVTQRLRATANDGTQIPVSVVYHTDTPLDGSAPLYLYGYGAYGLAMSPDFSASRISLLERGFIYAIAHIRGGDELGHHWYTDGKLDKRTNTFTDFVAVANHLIAENYCQSGRIAIAGGSAGGELMGAVVNLAPHLWGAVAAHVPFVDVLNTMLDATLPLTPPEWLEWGNPIEDPAAFAHIRSYSPYDQLAPGFYPPMLVTAGLNDPRVTYWEPAKYVAKLRHLKQDDNPLLLKTNMGAGHGGQSGRYDALKEIAEEYAFFISILS